MNLGLAPTESIDWTMNQPTLAYGVPFFSLRSFSEQSDMTFLRPGLKIMFFNRCVSFIKAVNKGSLFSSCPFGSRSPIVASTSANSSC